VDQSSHVARDGPTWALVAVRVGAFALGVAVILDALVTHAAVVQWVAGLVLVGIVPPEAVATLARRRR
jgi:hypothetical protein